MTALCFRPASIRTKVYQLYAAQILEKGEDLYNGSTGSTWDRVQYNFDQTNKGDMWHPYEKLTYKAAEWHKYAGLDKMSDREVFDLYKKALRLGIQIGKSYASAENIRAAAVHFEKRGWNRYEEKRDGKSKTAMQVGKWSLIVAGACFGIVLHSD